MEWAQASFRAAAQADVPCIVQLHRAIIGTAPAISQADIQEAWFVLGGPWPHEYYCTRHVKAYLDLGFDVWLVVTEEGQAVGNVELWYDNEPEPFGRYGHMELLELLPDYLADKVEEWLLDKVEDRVRERGYQRCMKELP
jgi:GNAT superfamily N-acetyltransferase